MVGILLAGCVHPGAREPGWVTRPGSAFSPSEYLVAVGHGSSREGANQSAMAELARQIRVSVRDEFDSTSSAVDLGNGDWTSRARTRRHTVVVADQTLEGARIARHWASGSGPQRHYSLAVLERAVYAENARKAVTSLDRQIELLSRTSQDQSALQRLHDLTRALDKSRERRRRNRALIAVTGTGIPAPQPPSDLQRRLDAERANVKLSVDTSSQWDDALQGAVRARGLSVVPSSANRMALRVERDSVHHEDGWFWLRATLVLDWNRQGEALGTARLPLKVSSTKRSMLEGRLRNQVVASIPRVLDKLLAPPEAQATEESGGRDGTRTTASKVSSAIHSRKMLYSTSNPGYAIRYKAIGGRTTRNSAAVAGVSADLMGAAMEKLILAAPAMGTPAGRHSSFPIASIAVCPVTGSDIAPRRKISVAGAS